MTIYLYCLTDPVSEPAAGLRGLGGELVRAVPVGHASAWVSDLGAGLGSATAEMVRAHDSVVRAALSIETPLPARFGQTFAGDQALRRALEARADGIARALDRVRGGVEMTVRVLLPEVGSEDVSRNFTVSALEGDEAEVGGAATRAAAGAPEGAGRAYMARLRDKRRAAAAIKKRAEFLQARVAHAVDGVVREEVYSTPSPAAHSFSVSHLVAREAIGQYRLRVDSLVRGDPILRLLVSGPWAPYSFARIADG